MILERAAYLLDGEYLTEAICDKSIPNAVEWVEKWLVRTGRGKDPMAGTGTQSRFNNAMYYNRTRTTPNYNQIGLDAVAAAKAEDRANGETHDQAYYDDVKKNAIKAAKDAETEARSQKHNESLAETLVEGVVIAFSHPIDYEKKGWAKMFIQAFTRIAFTECDYNTDHPNELKVDRLKKAYLTATMMWKAAKQNFGSEGFRNLFGDDPNMQGIGYNQLMNAVKGHYQEALHIWNVEKENYVEKQKELQAKNKLISAYYEAAYPNATEEEMKDYLKNNPDNFEPTPEAIAAMRAENDEAVQREIENYLNNVTAETTETDVPEPGHIPDINEPGKYHGLPNPYMEGTIRCGNYNVTRIHNYEESHTWLPFQNKTPEGDEDSGISWCLSYASNHWRGYLVDYPGRTCYFIWTDDFRTLKREDYPEAYSGHANATADTPWGRSLMCIIVKNEGPDRPWVFVQATSRYNHGDGHGEGFNNIQKAGDSFFSAVGDTVEAGAGALAQLMGTTPQEVMKRLPAVSGNEATAGDIRTLERYLDAGDFSHNPPGGIIMNRHNGNFVIKCDNDYRHYALIINGRWVNRTWYTGEPSRLNRSVNTLYKVRLDDGLYNVVDGSGKYMLPDNYPEIELYGNGYFRNYNDRYLVVRLNTSATLQENMFDIVTHKFVFKKPIYHIRNAVTITPTSLNNGIEAELTEEDHDNSILSVITPRGKVLFKQTEQLKVAHSGNINGSSINKYFITMLDYTIGGSNNYFLKSINDTAEGHYVLNVNSAQFGTFSDDGWFVGYGRVDINNALWAYYIVKPDGTTIQLYNAYRNEFNDVRFITGTHKVVFTGAKNLLFDPDADPNATELDSIRDQETAELMRQYFKYNYNDTNMTSLYDTALGYKYLTRHTHTIVRVDNFKPITDEIDTEVVLCTRLDKENYIFVARTTTAPTRWYYGTFNRQGEVHMIGPKSVGVTMSVGPNIIGDYQHAYYTIKLNGRSTQSLYDINNHEISHEYDDYHYIGNGLFLADLKASNPRRNLTTNKYVIIKLDGSKLINKEFDKLISAPGDEGYGVLVNNGTEYYYNTLGDCSTSLEDFNESVKVPAESNKYNFLYEAAAYLC